MKVGETFSHISIHLAEQPNIGAVIVGSIGVACGRLQFQLGLLTASLEGANVSYDTYENIVIGAIVCNIKTVAIISGARVITLFLTECEFGNPSDYIEGKRDRNRGGHGNEQLFKDRRQNMFFSRKLVGILLSGINAQDACVNRTSSQATKTSCSL